VFIVDLEAIGEAVKARRKRMKLTQSELSVRSRVSLARVEGLENGRLAEIGFKHLSRVLAALGLQLALSEIETRRPTLEDLRAEAEDT
jgi:transcriptional regulator with XRE-family HTH domain